MAVDLSFSRLKLIGIALAVGAVVILIAVLIRIYLRSRVTPEERERRRREVLSGNGKVGDGEITEIDGQTLVYEWQVAGVAYSAVQDVSALQSFLPEDRMSMIGPVTIKFDPRNPANSLILSEQWSGLRVRTAAIPRKA